MKFVVLILLGVALALTGCAKPPEQVYHHPKTGQKNIMASINECTTVAKRYGFINMSPVHQYPMKDMKDSSRRAKVFRFCMKKKGYEI